MVKLLHLALSTYMHKLLSCCLVFLFSIVVAYSQTGKTKTIVIDNRVSLVVPSSFREPEVMKSANNTGNNNTWRLLNKKEEIMIIYELGDSNDPAAVDINDNDVQEWADKQLTVLKQQSNFVYLDDGNFLQDGKNIGYIKFITKQPAGRNTYNLLFFTSVDNKLVQFNFTSPVKKQKKWEPIADEIANSLRVTASETPLNFL